MSGPTMRARSRLRLGHDCKGSILSRMIGFVSGLTRQDLASGDGQGTDWHDPRLGSVKTDKDAETFTTNYLENISANISWTDDEKKLFSCLQWLSTAWLFTLRCQMKKTIDRISTFRRSKRSISPESRNLKFLRKKKERC